MNIYKLGQFFKDDTGQLSAMRLVFITWGIGLFAIWATLSIETKTLVAMPTQAIEIMGLCLGGKVFQSFAENGAPVAQQPTIVVQQVPPTTPQ